MGFWKTLKWNAAAISIGSVALGVILTGWPAIAARTVCYLLAAVLLLGAFSYLLSYLSGRRQGLPSGMDLAIGLLLILAAAFVAVKADRIVGLVPLVMGAVFAALGQFVGSGFALKDGEKLVRPVIVLVMALLALKVLTGLLG